MRACLFFVRYAFALYNLCRKREFIETYSCLIFALNDYETVRYLKLESTNLALLTSVVDLHRFECG